MMDLESRIDELEIRGAHLEYTLQSQDEALLRLQQENQMLARQLRELSERVQAMATQPSVDPADEPPPPHY
jgi:SlyX protein